MYVKQVELKKINSLVPELHEFDELGKLNCKFDELDKLRMSLMRWMS